MSIDIPDSTPTYQWPLVVYVLDLVALSLFLLNLLVVLYVLCSIVRNRSLFFNVFWVIKVIQCIMAATWVVGLSLGDVWIWQDFNLAISTNLLCAPTMLAAFGLAQPIFLALLLFTVQLRVTDVVDRYHQDGPLGYRMVAGHEQTATSLEVNPSPKQLQGVRQKVSESVLCRASLAVLCPVMVQASAVPLMMWVAARRHSIVTQSEAAGESVPFPVECFQNWYEFFFQNCGQFEAEDGLAMPICRFSLLTMLDYVGTATIFLALFSHACISAKRQMFNKAVHRAFQRFQVIVSLIVLGAAACRTLAFVVEYEQFGPQWVPDLLTICANLCEASFLLVNLLFVLRG